MPQDSVGGMPVLSGGRCDSVMGWYLARFGIQRESELQPDKGGKEVWKEVPVAAESSAPSLWKRVALCSKQM